MKMYCVQNKKTKQFLNYAESYKPLFGRGRKYYVVTSPFPTLRPLDCSIEHFKNWINNTPKPEEYQIICFTMAKTELTIGSKEPKDTEKDAAL